jgi:hypothetical protein
MLVGMFLGMAVLMLPADAAMVALGASSGDVYGDAPAVMLIAMTRAMTVPMVAWMRYRGHSWRPSMEMAASMVVPTLALLALLWTGLMTDSATLMAVLHAVMLPSMLVVMLLRRDEYTGHHAHALHESAA